MATASAPATCSSNCLRNPNVEVVACCDADAKQLEYTARIVEGEKPNNTRDKNLNAYRQPIPSGEPDPNRKTNVKVKRFKDFRDLVVLTAMSMPSSSPRPITGTPSPPSPPAKPARMSTARSRSR